MATTSTTFTVAEARFGFISEIVNISESPIPKAEIIYAITGGTVTAAAAGEDQEMIIFCPLRQGYAYVLTEMEMLFREAEAGDIGDWDASMTATTTNGAWVAANRFDGGIAVNNSTSLQDRTFKCAQPTQKIIIPTGPAAANLFIRGWNTSIDGGPMTVNFLARFLEFDLQQAHHWAIQSQFPVR